MDANQSIKSSLIHNGLSAEKEEAVRKFYQNFLRMMGSASEYGLDFQFDLRMKVTPSPEEMPSAILDTSASAAEERAEDMEARHKREMAEALAHMKRAHTEKLQAVEKQHQEWQAATQARYADALTPLLGIRDKMRAECEKKVEEADRKAHAMGYAFADQKWNPVYKAVCEELELVRNEGANHEAGYIRLIGERDKLILAQADMREELDEKLEAQAEELAAAQKELSGWYERCVAAQNAAEKLQGEVDSVTQLLQAVRSDLEGLSAENKALKGKNEALLELVGPTIAHMKSNPELFGGEALPSGPASPRPPAILRLRPVKEEDEEKVEKILKAFVRPVFRHSAVVERPTPSALPGLVEAEGLCGAWRGCDEDEDQPTVCGATGCNDCAPAEEAKPKPNYNHQFWPSPTTKRFAKHLAKHSGGHSHDPKTIKTHEDALEYIAKRVNISVENLLGWTMKQYQTTYDPWTLVEGPNKFHTGTAPATWWC